MDFARVEKHKKRKHKHRSKHKKHKHSSPDERDQKHKYKHKHKRKHRDSFRDDRECSTSYEGAADSPKRFRLDDLAALEDLEKQRAMIQAELDNELMEGSVQSGMGLILQGYNSDSEDGEVQEAVRNGEQQRKDLDELVTVKGNGRKLHQDYVNDEQFYSVLKGRTMSEEVTVQSHKSEKRESMTGLGIKISERPSGPSEMKERRRSRSTDRSKDRSRRSKSPVKSKEVPSSSATSNRKSNTQPEEQAVDHRSSSRSSKSGSKERSTSLPEVDRDKKPAKAPLKEVSSGKENRSPSRKQGPDRLSPSVQPRSHRSPERLPVVQNTDRASRQDRSTCHNRSPPGRGRSRSVERRRREEERQRLSSDRMRSRDMAGAHREDSPSMSSRRRLNHSPLRRRSRSPRRRSSRSPLRHRERDRMDRRQPVRSRSQERRRRRSKEREDMFKGSLSEGMKAEQEDSDENISNVWLPMHYCTIPLGVFFAMRRQFRCLFL
nr:Zgc:56223 [Danio rerio]